MCLLWDISLSLSHLLAHADDHHKLRAKEIISLLKYVNEVVKKKEIKSFHCNYQLKKCCAKKNLLSLFFPRNSLTRAHENVSSEQAESDGISTLFLLHNSEFLLLLYFAL